MVAALLSLLRPNSVACCFHQWFLNSVFSLYVLVITMLTGMPHLIVFTVLWLQESGKVGFISNPLILAEIRDREIFCI